MAIDYEQVLERAKQGNLSRSDVEQAAAELRDPNSRVDRYRLIHILGLDPWKSHRPLLESFLENVGDPMLTRIALKSLCSYWGDTERYLEQLLRFLRGVSWDEEDDVRQVALFIAGDYLRSHDQPELLREVIRTFENEDEEPIMREGAYLALARGIGREWQELPSPARHFDLQHDIDQAVLRHAKQLLLRH